MSVQVRIRACCGTPDDRRAPSPHAAGCRYAADPPGRSGGPFCIMISCPIIPLHRFATEGCKGRLLAQS